MTNSKRKGVRGKRDSIKDVIHGMSGTKIYWIWAAMIDRCRNENNPQYKDYGGRGIKVCESWYDFRNFYSDMGERPEGKSLDRLNNNADYNKENCEWSVIRKQTNNRRNVKKHKIYGYELTLSQLSVVSGISKDTIKARIGAGLSGLEAIYKKPRYKKTPKLELSKEELIERIKKEKDFKS